MLVWRTLKLTVHCPSRGRAILPHTETGQRRPLREPSLGQREAELVPPSHREVYLGPNNQGWPSRRLVLSSQEGPADRWLCPWPTRGPRRGADRPEWEPCHPPRTVWKGPGHGEHAGTRHPPPGEGAGSLFLTRKRQKPWAGSRCCQQQGLFRVQPGEGQPHRPQGT